MVGTDLAVVETAEAAQDVIEQAQSSGDQRLANQAYQRKLEIMNGQPGQPARTPAALVPRERTDQIMANMEGDDPESADALRRAWRGDLHANLAFSQWVVDRYSVTLPNESPASLLQAGIALGRGAFRELHPDQDLPDLSAATVRAFEAELGEPIPGHLRGAVKFAEWALKAGGFRGGDLDDEALFRVTAAIGRQVFAGPENRSASPGTTTTNAEGRDVAVASMNAGEFDDAMEDMQKRIDQAMTERNHKKANRLYGEKLAMRQARDGGSKPMVGRGGRTS